MNGAKLGNEIAVSKWEDDLEFVEEEFARQVLIGIFVVVVSIIIRIYVAVNY